MDYLITIVGNIAGPEDGGVLSSNTGSVPHPPPPMAIQKPHISVRSGRNRSHCPLIAANC
jgi:hypothetical protein